MKDIRSCESGSQQELEEIRALYQKEALQRRLLYNQVGFSFWTSIQDAVLYTAFSNVQYALFDVELVFAKCAMSIHLRRKGG